MCVPNDEVLRKEMLDEAHQSSFSIYPGSKSLQKALGTKVNLSTAFHPQTDDPSHMLEPEEVELNPDLSCEEEPVMILDREVKRLRNKNVSLVKVLWRNHKVEEATWESEETMRMQYPYLFDYGKD
ncbi:hypothetical protein V6N12_007816 [Hibiscus sabdariffa]|uniref:Chromo domain-containing protein n=1 Tax=Hibiscus sabdariffa TaxID=183260 RepID=A0ABR2F2V4_9ROSI